MKQTYGYARVSTVDQDLRVQLDALEAAGCDRVFTDKASGGTRERPGLDAVLAVLEAGDELVVTRLDRLGRSVADLVHIVIDLGERGVEFRSLIEGFDTTTSGGKLLFHVMAAIAEFERELIRERVNAGLAAARARGRIGGRPRVMTPEKARVARDLNASNTPVTTIAAVLGVSRATVYRSLAEHEARAS
jgi:DNA invertase Pin-like site-specific DNA recombinase